MGSTSHTKKRCVFPQHLHTIQGLFELPLARSKALKDFRWGAFQLCRTFM